MTMMMTPPKFRHDYPFDPSYGYSEEELLKVVTPGAPVDFEDFWRGRLEKARNVSVQPRLEDSGRVEVGWRILDVHYTSTNGVRIGGWLLLPEDRPVRRGFVVGHGYGGRDAPDFHLPMRDAALFFPCARGLSRSRADGLPADAAWHVIHGVESRETYLHGGCVEDVWTAVTALEEMVPETIGKIGYLGISFGGGVGVMAAAWDERILRSHVNVPSFGNIPLRMELPTVGSGAALRLLYRKRPEILDVLQYFDAAIHAQFLIRPIHLACAAFDPAVAPPGQYAIHNAVAGQKQLFALSAGHFDYPEQEAENARLLQEIDEFFDVA